MSESFKRIQREDRRFLILKFTNAGGGCCNSAMLQTFLDDMQHRVAAKALAADVGDAIYDYRAVPKFKAFKNSLRNADDKAKSDCLPILSEKKRNLSGSAASFFHPSQP